MDEIQKVLVKEGRKDLAQEYYKKVAVNKVAVDISEVDPKIQNRISKIKEIYQQIKRKKDAIQEQVGSIQQEIKVLERQAKIFEKEVLPILKDLEDHAITAEGIFIELKKGRRSPKEGYDFLASKVNSDLLKAAEAVIADAATFAKSPSITVSHVKTAGILQWLKKRWQQLVGWAKKLKGVEKSLGKSVADLDRATR